MNRVKAFLKKHIVCCASAILLISFCLLLSVVLFLTGNSRDYVSLNLTLNYDGVSSGLDPFKAQLDLSSFVDEALVSEALGNLELLDNYDPGEVLSNFAIIGNTSDRTVERLTGENSSSVSSQQSDTLTGYYPASFTLELCRDFSGTVSARRLRAILSEITRLLSEKLVKTYSRSFSASAINGRISERSYEYMHRLDIDCDTINAIASYSAFLSENYPYFSYNGSNFETITRKCSGLSADMADRIRSGITINGLTNNVAWIPDYYEYKIRVLGYDLTALETDLATVVDQIAAFDPDSSIYLSSGDTVVKVESKSKETYEELVALRISLNSEIASVKSDISYYTDRLAVINSSSSSPALYSSLRSDFTLLESKIDEISSEFNKMLGALNEELADGLVTSSKITTNFRSLFSVAFIVFTAKIAIIVCFPAAAVLLLIPVFVKKRKK